MPVTALAVADFEIMQKSFSVAAPPLVVNDLPPRLIHLLDLS